MFVKIVFGKGHILPLQNGEDFACASDTNRGEKDGKPERLYKFGRKKGKSRALSNQFVLRP